MFGCLLLQENKNMFSVIVFLISIRLLDVLVLHICWPVLKSSHEINNGHKKYAGYCQIETVRTHYSS